MEYFSIESGCAFVNEFCTHIQFCEELNQQFEAATSENEETPNPFEILEHSFTQAELVAIEQYHSDISKALGTAVGICKHRKS